MSFSVVSLLNLRDLLIGAQACGAQMRVHMSEQCISNKVLRPQTCTGHRDAGCVGGIKITDN